jgi:hypothetical protein
MEDYSCNLVEFDERFASEEGLHCVPDVASLAQGVCVPQVWWGPSVAAGPAGDGLHPLSSRDLDHGRNTVREDAQTAEGVVQGDVVGHQPEDRRKCSRTAASARLGQLRDRVVVASQASSGHGFAQGGIVSKAASRSTKPMWVAPKRAPAADKPRRSPLWS